MAQQIKSLTPVRVDIRKVVIDRAFNVRETDGYDVKNLLDDLATRGQQDPATIEELPDGTYRMIRGHRRATAILQATEKGVTDPLTGQPFNSILAIVRNNLTETDRIKLLLDDGQRLGLSKVELFYAIERAVKAQWTEKETVAILRSLLEHHYPPARKIEPPTDEKFLDYYRGVIQTAKRMALAPTVLRDAYVRKLKGEQAWPIKSDAEHLFKVFTKELEQDKSNTINRDNPGPEFVKAWEEYTRKQEEAIAEGGTRAKAISMMNADQIGKLKPASDSRILKTVIDVIKRERQPEVWASLDALLKDVEQQPEVKAKLDMILRTSTDSVSESPQA